jgi:hypothetical protein
MATSNSKLSAVDKVRKIRVLMSFGTPSSSHSKASIGLFFLRSTTQNTVYSTDTARQLDVDYKPLTRFVGCFACKENRVNAEGIPVSEKDLARLLAGKTIRAATSQ